MDCFNIKKIYQDKVGGPSWDSRHWNNGKSRTVKSGYKDTFDPTSCSENRGNCTWSVDGKGMLLFNGPNSGTTEPRFHLNNPSKYFFRDVECTMYMMRIKDKNVNWGGCTIGVRSGPDGHSISSKYCDAHTYYQRIRNDGTCDVEKELKHPDSSTRSTKITWPKGTTFPFNTWVGYKSVTYNVSNGVCFELYRDLTGGVNGGTWVKLFSTIDTGGWAPKQSSPVCSYAKDYIPMQGGGVIVMRNTGTTTANYKWMTVREITSKKFIEDEIVPIGIELQFTEQQQYEGCEDCLCTTEQVEPSVECINCENGQCDINNNEVTTNIDSIENDVDVENDSDAAIDAAIGVVGETDALDVLIKDKVDEENANNNWNCVIN